MNERRSELRAQAMERAGYQCEWPACTTRRPGELQMAHLQGVGLGGRPSADTLANVAMLCSYHHDLLDGRSHAGLRREMGLLLNRWVNRARYGQPAPAQQRMSLPDRPGPEGPDPVEPPGEPEGDDTDGPTLCDACGHEFHGLSARCRGVVWSVDGTDGDFCPCLGSAPRE